MTSDINRLKKHLSSESKAIRLKSLKLLLNHPHASVLDLVRGLCSTDNRNFEFLDVYGLDLAMKNARKRLQGCDDETVYNYLSHFYLSDPAHHSRLVIQILQTINTPSARAWRGKLGL